VKGRAIAYSEERDGFHQDMPFENVHGNGGLLTTVGDLLRWMRNFSQPKVGDAAFIALEQQPGRFNDGRPHEYALGLFIDTYKGVREVQHSGSTAGYRAYIADYPDQRVSVAVLCNAANGNATQYAHTVADLFLGDAVKGRRAEPSDNAPAAAQNGAPVRSLSEAEMNALTGMYRNADNGQPLTVSREGNTLRLDRGGVLTPVSAATFALVNGSTLEFAGGGARMTDRFGTVESYERTTVAKPDRAALQAYLGTYTSEEAEVTLSAVLDGDTLVLNRRPDAAIRLTPVYTDAFRGSIGLVRFIRDTSARVTGFSVSQDRVWDLRFARTTATTGTTRTTGRPGTTGNEK
jgi:beta-lactamase family protein